MGNDHSAISKKQKITEVTSPKNLNLSKFSQNKAEISEENLFIDPFLEMIQLKDKKATLRKSYQFNVSSISSLHVKKKLKGCQIARIVVSEKMVNYANIINKHINFQFSNLTNLDFVICGNLNYKLKTDFCLFPFINEIDKKVNFYQDILLNTDINFRFNTILQRKLKGNLKQETENKLWEYDNYFNKEDKNKIKKNPSIFKTTNKENNSQSPVNSKIHNNIKFNFNNNVQLDFRLIKNKNTISRNKMSKANLDDSPSIKLSRNLSNSPMNRSINRSHTSQRNKKIKLPLTINNYSNSPTNQNRSVTAINLNSTNKTARNDNKGVEQLFPGAIKMNYEDFINKKYGEGFGNITSHFNSKDNFRDDHYNIYNTGNGKKSNLFK